MRLGSPFASVRPPAIAGTFYPAPPGELDAQVRSYLAAAGDPSSAGLPAPRALIVPHAGLVYSGIVAASAFRQLAARRSEIERVVLIGPAHRAYVDGLAVPSVSAFATPLGMIPIDLAARDVLLGIAGVTIDDRAHAFEHCLEVELPFLQVVLDEFRLLPVLVGDAAPDLVARVLDAVWSGPATVVLASSDLSHYHAYDDAVAIDERTARAICERSTRLEPDQACGAYAVNGLMLAALRRDLEVTELARLNSGDTAGDRRRVVGYGSFALHDARST